jgi:regulatory protein
MAQSWRVKHVRNKKPRPPLDETALERLALFYVGRYATTRARLGRYLNRKLQEQGWAGSGEPPVGTLVERLCELRYVDDGAFAAARAASLQRRGFGERRIAQALRASGIQAEDADAVREQTRPGAMEAALRFAERRRIGPFAAEQLDREARRKAFAAMMRAGHPFDLARQIVEAGPGEVPEYDNN